VSVVYFDASAFVKLLIDEDRTDLAVDLWDGCDAAISSRLAYPEVRAALAAAVRANRIDAADHAAVESRWEILWASVRSIELTPRIAESAGDLCRDHALRGADGIHLASALQLVDADPVVAVWDSRLAAGAVTVGLRVSPPPPDD
jgi:uncharacterized protein